MFSLDGVVGSPTRMGVPQVGPSKQLWLRNNCAVIPTALELARSMEFADWTMQFTSPHYSDDVSLSGVVGDCMSMRDADAVASRTCLRLRLWLEYRIKVASEYVGPERTMADAFGQYPFSPVGSYVVPLCFVDGRLHALVGSSLVSLPKLCVAPPDDKGKSRRSAAMAAAERLITDAFTCTATGFLCHDGPDGTVVASPVAFTPTGDADSFARWVTLDELSASPLYAPVSFAMNHCSAWMHGSTTFLPDAIRGARSARPFMTPAYQPALSLDSWSKQLALAEQTDVLLRRVLDARLDVTREDQYLKDWVAQIDSAPNARVPLQLREYSLIDFDDPQLVTTPFAHVDGIPTTREPAPKAARPPVGFRPRKLSHLLMAKGLALLISGLLAVVADVESLARNPDAFVRTATTVVIKQDQWWPDARGVLWDLRHPCFDDEGPYFVPVSDDEPLGSHVSDGLFDELGESYPDQRLRFMCRQGMVFDADNPNMDIVICPHLLSLSRGFERVQQELSRLRTAGYLEYVDPHVAHSVTDSAGEEIILALGYLPFRANPQGTVERKLFPGRPRRVEDAGAPHNKPGRDSGTRSLNELIRERVEPIPPEIKPQPMHAMRDNAILQSAARVWGEPVVGFCDDMRDMFNQLFTHVRQRFLTTILWRGDDGRVLHILEKSLGFGVTVNSNYAQRFANAVVFLVMKEFDAEEDKLFAAEADPSRLQWIRERQALSATTHRNECRLYSAHIFTDDPVFQVVGVNRCVRLMLTWFRVTRRLNLRMADAAKRIGGSTGLWLGVRFFYTLGIVAIEPNKRERAVAALTDIVARARPSLGEYESLVGLLEHLLPFTGMDRSFMHYLHAPKNFAKEKSSLIRLTDDIVRQAARWLAVLATRAGVSVKIVIAVVGTLVAGTMVTEMSSDAAKAGTANPGLGGHLHGYTWRCALLAEDIEGVFEIAIAVLEFAALVINLMTFARRIALGRRVIIVVTDSSTTADALVDARARADLMQFCYEELNNYPPLEVLKGRLYVQHGWGDGNTVSDASSRGYDDVLAALCRNMRVRHEHVDVPPEAIDFLRRLRERNRAIVLARAAEVSERNSEMDISPDPDVDDPFGDGVRIGESAVPGPPPNKGKAPARGFNPPRPHSGDRSRSASPSANGRLLDFTILPGFDRRGAPPPSALPPRLAPSSTRRDSPVSSRASSPSSRASSPGCGTKFIPVAIHPSASKAQAAPRPRDSPDPGVRPEPKRLAFDASDSPSHRAASPSPRPPIRHADREFSATAGAAEFVAALKADTSAHALKPDDPDELERSVLRVASACDAGVPDNTSRKDAGYWNKWCQYCARYNTPVWRDCTDANSGVDAFGNAREVYFQAAFVLDYYDNMKPRRRDRSQADPRGAVKAAQAVRRAHANRGIRMPAAPTINKCLKGLLMDYVRLHGSEALAPMRKEPLTNAQTTSMLTVKNGTCIGKRTVVDWESNVFVSFACLLAGLRHTGGRKADHLPVKAAEFDGRHMRRSNLRWKLRNKLYADPPHELLADLQPGDCAVLAPASSKNDPTGTTFGDRPMHLPFVPNDITNAAAWYARLELRMPVKGNARKTTPLYTVGNMISLDHATAVHVSRACVACVREARVVCAAIVCSL